MELEESFLLFQDREIKANFRLEKEKEKKIVLLLLPNLFLSD